MVNKDAAFKSNIGVNRRTNIVWRINSFVGEPVPVTASGLSLETTRSKIPTTAIKAAAAQIPP